MLMLRGLNTAVVSLSEAAVPSEPKVSFGVGAVMQGCQVKSLLHERAMLTMCIKMQHFSLSGFDVRDGELLLLVCQAALHLFCPSFAFLYQHKRMTYDPIL